MTLSNRGGDKDRRESCLSLQHKKCASKIKIEIYESICRNTKQLKKQNRTAVVCVTKISTVTRNRFVSTPHLRHVYTVVTSTDEVARRFLQNKKKEKKNLVRFSAGSVCCFLEQETFTPQKYW